MSIETEVKFALNDPLAFRRKLQDSAVHSQGPVFEDNLVLETPDGRLRKAGMLLRLRRDRRTLLTFKRPFEGPGPTDLKCMEEWEIQVDDFEITCNLLAALGFCEAFRYEKIREIWRLGDALICLDRLPFGCYVEIEGEESVVRQAAAKLGLSMSQGLTENYHELNLSYRRQAGLPKEDGFAFATEFRQKFFHRKDTLSWLKEPSDFC